MAKERNRKRTYPENDQRLQRDREDTGNCSQRVGVQDQRERNNSSSNPYGSRERYHFILAVFPVINDVTYFAVQYANVCSDNTVVALTLHRTSNRVDI